MTGDWQVGEGPLREGVRAGDAEAVRAWVARDHPCAEMLAAATIDASASQAEPLAAAWEATVDAVVAGTVTDLRAGLLDNVIGALGSAGALDPPSPAASPYYPAGHRWAGWWPAPPPLWPDNTPGRDLVLRAVRQLNLGLRVALVLQDAAGLAPHRAAQIMGIPVEKHAAVLDAARRGFMRYLDEGMGADAAA
jgi:hypothetical protein